MIFFIVVLPGVVIIASWLGWLTYLQIRQLRHDISREERILRKLPRLTNSRKQKSRKQK